MYSAKSAITIDKQKWPILYLELYFFLLIPTLKLVRLVLNDCHSSKHINEYLLEKHLDDIFA